MLRIAFFLSYRTILLLLDSVVHNTKHIKLLCSQVLQYTNKLHSANQCVPIVILASAADVASIHSICPDIRNYEDSLAYLHKIPCSSVYMVINQKVVLTESIARHCTLIKFTTRRHVPREELASTNRLSDRSFCSLNAFTGYLLKAEPGFIVHTSANDLCNELKRQKSKLMSERIAMTIPAPQEATAYMLSYFDDDLSSVHVDLLRLVTTVLTRRKRFWSRDPDPMFDSIHKQISDMHYSSPSFLRRNAHSAKSMADNILATFASTECNVSGEPLAVFVTGLPGIGKDYCADQAVQHIAAVLPNIRVRVINQDQFQGDANKYLFELQRVTSSHHIVIITRNGPGTMWSVSLSVCPTHLRCVTYVCSLASHPCVSTVLVWHCLRVSCLAMSWYVSLLGSSTLCECLLKLIL